MINLLPIKTEQVTINGITFTSDAETGYVYANGTATDKAVYIIATNDELQISSNADAVILGCPSYGRNKYYIQVWNGTDADFIDYGYGKTGHITNLTDTGNVSIVIKRGTIVSNLAFKPFLGSVVGAVRFNSGGGLTRKKITDELYGALQVSGFVTPSMTYEQMLDALKVQYPEFDGVFYEAGDQKTVATNGWKGSGSYSFGASSMNIQSQGTSIVEPNLTVLCSPKFKYLNVRVVASTYDVNAHQYWASCTSNIGLLNSDNAVIAQNKTYEYGSHGEDKGAVSNNGTWRLAIPSAYIGKMIKPRIWSTSVSETFVSLTIDKVWLTEQ